MLFNFHLFMDIAYFKLYIYQFTISTNLNHRLGLNPSLVTLVHTMDDLQEFNRQPASYTGMKHVGNTLSAI